MSAVIVVSTFDPFVDLDWKEPDLNAVQPTQEELAFMSAIAKINEPEEPSLFVGE